MLVAIRVAGDEEGVFVGAAARGVAFFRGLVDDEDVLED